MDSGKCNPISPDGRGQKHDNLMEGFTALSV